MNPLLPTQLSHSIFNLPSQTSKKVILISHIRQSYNPLAPHNNTNDKISPQRTIVYHPITSDYNYLKTPFPYAFLSIILMHTPTYIPCIITK